MTDRDRETRGADWVDTTAGDHDTSGSGEAEGTGSLGAPPTKVGRGALPDTDPGAGGASEERSDLGGVDVGGGGKPGAGLGETRGGGFGTGTGGA
jgi:hypothetical protein